MNKDIEMAVASLCDDIATNTNADDNRKRAEAIFILGLGGALIPENKDDLEGDYEGESEQPIKPENTRRAPMPGEHFNYKGIEFVVLGAEQGGILAVVAKPLEERMAFDESNRNDWRGSTLQEFLNGEYLERLGKADLLPLVSDLTADDGMTDYGTSEDYVAILSDNLYRKYKKVVPKYDIPVWSITPWSCLPGHAYYGRIVYTSGVLSSYLANYTYGVAPACLFNPSIF